VIAHFVPMASTLVREPFHRPGWVYEEKYDGWRMLAFKDGARARLISRQGVDHTARFGELAAAIAQLRAPELVLEGEVCVFDEDLVSQFHLLGRPDPAIIATPPVLMAFDCLRVHGVDVRGLPLHRRRAMLEEELVGASMVFPARRLTDHGHAAWAVVNARGYEGLVGKDEESAYRGGPSRAWLKLKVRHEGAFAIGGIAKDGEHFRGLLLGRRRGRGLAYVGFVEYGFTRAAVGEIFARSRNLVRPTSPFSTAPDHAGVWLEPALLAEISYSELMDGWLRDPMYRGLMSSTGG
jgi:bifunctional non-homologous end joining protein LigD